MEARTGRGAVVSLTGEAGLGKSRLIAEVCCGWPPMTASVSMPARARRTVNSSYLAWQPIWRRLFAITPDMDGDAAAHVQAKLAAVDPGLVRRAPLLAPVLNVALSENDLTRSLDARARKVSLESLLLDCLRAEVEHAPMVLVLEDCHWLDPLAGSAGSHRPRAGDPAHASVAGLSRPGPGASPRRPHRRCPTTATSLAPFTYAEAREFVAAKFGLTAADAPRRRR
ncbi:MAG: AAA family ATPase [Caldilineaceae bacterium]